MSRRKRFPCGHRGFGQYCHRCAQGEVTLALIEGAEPRPMKAAPPREAAGVSLTHLHPDIARRAAKKLELIEHGTGYRALGGKRLQSSGLISIPLGQRYRIVCRDGDDGLQVLAVLSHEAYNHVV